MMGESKKNTKEKTNKKQNASKQKHSPKHINSSKSNSKKTKKTLNSNKKNNLSSKEITEEFNKINKKHEKLKAKIENNTGSEASINNKEIGSSDDAKHKKETDQNVEQTKNIIEEQKKQDAKRALDKNKKKRATALKEKLEKAKRKKFAIITVSCILGVYLIGVLVFCFLNFPRTIIADTDLSFHTLGATEEVLKNNSSDYDIDIDGLDFNYSISGNQIDYKFDINSVIERIKEYKNPFLWPYEIFVIHDFQDKHLADFDEAEVDRLASEQIIAHNQTAVLPQNAGFTYNIIAKTASIKNEINGNTINLDNALAAIKAHIGAASKHLTLKENEQALPSIYASDARMEGALSTANTMIKAVLSLKIDQALVSTVDIKLISTFIGVNEDYKTTINQDALATWVEQLASQCDTLGKARTYVTPYGKTVTVKGGSFGWQINQGALVEQLSQQIAAGATTTISVPCSSTFAAYTGVGQRDWGARYIDIDLSQQHARMYNEAGALVWESPIISGLPSKPTPTGIYKINQKKSPETLIGLPLPGQTEPEYRTTVTYWMPFVGNSVGLHDAPWQSSFGGSTWLTSGSHGCINLPPGAAATLYSICNTGDVVVCHN